VFDALGNIEAEVFVVDNHSSDDSVNMIYQEFPQVKVIANKTNFGFSKANNQAINQANGDYVLLLNPDTLVEKDTFEKCLLYMESKSNTERLKKQGYWKFRGWYALRIEK
jgi:GT2 family glycosyltransferase